MLISFLEFFMPSVTTVDQAYELGQKHGLKVEDYFNDKGIKALQNYGVHLSGDLVVELRDHVFEKWVEENPV